MHISDNPLSSSMGTVLVNVLLPVRSKSEKTNIFIEAKERDILNIKWSTVTLDMSEYKEKDIFKEHLMLNVW